jgi:hypothetical integral membrane protein (TIGR02206 family)
VTLQHLVSVAVFALAVAVMSSVGRRFRGTPDERRYGIALSVCVWALWFGYQGYDIATKGFSARHALPLQLSDVTAAVAGLVFLFPNRKLQSLAYFLGLALGSQAVLTPDLTDGPTTISFWAFWIYHLFVVGAGIYVIAVQGFRPAWRDLRFALLVGLAYVAIVFSIDAVFDLNYGYLGRPTPSRPTLLDYLGPWPLRVVFMVLLASAVMCLMLLPWWLVDKHGKKQTARTTSHG